MAGQCIVSETGHSGGRRLQDHLFFRDRARSQKGILQAGTTTIYRNVEAELFSFEVDVPHRITPSTTFSGAPS